MCGAVSTDQTTVTNRIETVCSARKQKNAYLIGTAKPKDLRRELIILSFIQQFKKVLRP
jgi:hypothetical protein